MKQILSIIMISTLFLTGCVGNKDISNLSSEEAIIKVLGEYDENSKIGMNKELYTNDKDEIEINYIIETESTQALADTYGKDLENKELEYITDIAMKDISQIMMNKLEELYINKNLDKILVRIYTKVENDKLFGIRTFRFDRGIYNTIDWSNVNKENYIYTELKD